MSDEDDLFGSSDGGDTDDLIAESQKSKPIAKPKSKPTKKKLGGTKKKLGGAKKRLQKKKSASKKRKLPDADNDSDDEDASFSGGKKEEEDGLFDDSDDEKETAAAAPKKPLSKKERMEALMAKKRQAATSSSEGAAAAADGTKKKKKKRGDKATGDAASKDKQDGYDSADSYESVNFERTQEDNDFIDMDDDDQDAINELYAEQHFDDERPEGEDSEDDEEGRSKKKKSSSGKYKGRGPDSLSAEDKADTDNPMMQAVMKMQKVKRAPKKTSELEDEVKDFLNRMEEAAELDEKSIEQRKPATRKLQMLQHVVDTLTRKDIMRMLLDFDVLSICKRWIQPLPKTGKLGNVTVRQRIIDCVSNMKGEQGITAHDLKKSGFGKVIMSLYMHKSETPTLKRQLKSLIERWSRPIFQKSGDMRDLQLVHATRGIDSLGGIARQQQQTPVRATKQQQSQGTQGRDLHSLIASGSSKNKADANGPGVNRVRVPYSKGFQYTVRPTDKTGTVTDKRMAIAGPNDKRANLSKRMVEKARAANKNQRSANISIEGRPTK